MAINRLGMLQYPCAQCSAECAFAHRDHSIRVIVISGRGRCAALSAAISLVLRLLGKLADVDIEAVTLNQASCRGSEPCPGPRRASVRGTVAAVSVPRRA